MTLLPTSVWEDVATKTDLELHDPLKLEIALLRLDIAELRIEMHQMFRKNYVVMISAIFAINSLFFMATKYWG